MTAQQLIDGEKIAGDNWEYPPLPRYEQTKEILRQIAPVLRECFSFDSDTISSSSI